MVHAALTRPETPSASRQRLPFEYTPLYTGAPRRRVLRDPHVGVRTVGGTLVESLGFGGDAPRVEVEVDADGCVGVPVPPPFTLAHMIGASSAITTPDHDVRGYPHAPYWTLPVVAGEPCVVNDLFTDGGDVDNLALLGLLRRRIPAIVVFINSVWPLALDYDPRQWPDGQIDPAVPPLFGQPSSRWPHNRVFARSAYREVVSAWQTAKRAGQPVVASTRLMVEPNPWWGIDGEWAVSVCWVYNDRVPIWEAGLQDDVRRLLPPGTPQTPDTALVRFPHYRTIGENSGALTRLTPLQANMLAELAGWVGARIECHAAGRARRVLT